MKDRGKYFFFARNCKLSVHQITKVYFHPVLRKKSFYFEEHIKEIYLFAYGRMVKYEIVYQTVEDFLE